MKNNPRWNELEFWLKLIAAIMMLENPCASIISIESDKETHFVEGMVRTNLPDALYYDTFIPIIYEIDLPNWNEANLKLDWPSNYTIDCNLTHLYLEDWSHMACPISHYMNNVTSHLIKKIMDWKNVNSTTKTKKVELPSCHEIMPHFLSYSLGHEEKDDYLHEDLKNCPVGQVIFEKMDYSVPSVKSDIYENMLSRFIEETTNTKKFKPKGSNMQYTTITNAYTGLQTLQLLDYVHTASKFSEALDACYNARIPYTLIGKDTFGASLKEAETSITSKDDYKLTVDVNDLSTYYKMPLADCVFTSKNTFLVRILVPLKKLDWNYKLGIITPIPFLRHFGNKAELCEYAVPRSKVIIEESTSYVLPIQCESGVLCYVPDSANRPNMDYCLHALVKNSTEEMLDFCDFTCTRFSPHHLPYFRRLGTDKYAILGQSNMDIFVSCEATPYKVVYPPVPVGALEITLPCTCQLIHDRITLHSMTPCGNKMGLREILPKIWSSVFTSAGITTNKKLESSKNHQEESHNVIPERSNISKDGNNSDNRQRAKLFLLSAAVATLFMLVGCLLYTVRKLHQRISRLEKAYGNNGFGNIYETPLPMYGRANDD